MCPTFTPQLLTSAIVHVLNSKNGIVKCRALLDTCATANFISEPFLKKLGVRPTPQSIPIGAINAMNSSSRGVVQLIIQSTQGNFQRKLVCLTLPTVADLIPSETFPRDAVKLPPNIKLADPEFHVPRPVDLLIGAGTTLSLFSVGQINLSNDELDLYLQKTRLGWIIAGSSAKQNVIKEASCCLTSLESQIARFWIIEEIANDKFKSEEETNCESHFANNTTRNSEGRYVVRLPFRHPEPRIGDSRSVALKRLLALERKLDRDQNLKSEYTRIIEEYKTLGHMSLVTRPSDDGFYMPHHAVIKLSSSTTKVRIVFDASAKSRSDVSLNDLLMVGPTIQETLFSHLIRFRAYNYVMTADIEKMYRQVLVHENDRRYQMILWRERDEIKTYQLNTLTFGVASSPFLAIRALQQLADDDGHLFPEAAKAIKKHLYVDDLLTGANSIREAREIRDGIIALLHRGGYTIRQWASNDTRVIHDLPNNALHANYSLGEDQSLKTLGISWITRDDKICYYARAINIPGIVSKRNILSEIAKIYDPLGLLGPVVLCAKQIMQDLWRTQVHWDESVPQAIYSKWSEFSRQLKSMDRISFDRKITAEAHCVIQLHGFCDASNAGYGACIYVRSIDKKNQAVCRILCSKSRVSPLKPVTIPRLELCGALLLARLYRETRAALNIVPDKVIFWCDSTIVLHWLKTAPHLLKTYVANRVVAIREITDSHQWRHIRSEDNPADAVSRGQLPHVFLKNNMWRTGPAWLAKIENEWPEPAIQTIEVPELKRNICLVTSNFEFDILERYSSHSKLCRIVAYCLRVRPGNMHHGPLSPREIDEAEIRIIKLLQSREFVDEIKKLNHKTTPYQGKLINLNPFMDEDGVLRVGGRLQSSKLPASQRHPMLLPSRNRVSDRIIREIHERYYHTGIQGTLYAIRQKFWLLDGRNQVRKVIRTCLRCRRFVSKAAEYKMGNLPESRVCETIPFTNTGIDFCGPFFVKEKKHRNRNRVKAYVCVFICMTIKAVHLEVVSDMTSDGFLAALRRFVARRGLPRHIHSDNGTNFVGANNQLRELYALFNSNEHIELVNQYVIKNHITWHFIPPTAPHFGGLWESTVKLFKHHIKRVVGDLLFTFEEFNTFTTEIEGILNSRPITSLSSDPNDLPALTPAHYLIGKPLMTLPECDLQSIPGNRLSAWQHIMKVRQDFWARWHLEYLNELQKRAKWNTNKPNLAIDTVVLIKEPKLPCTSWALGRIIKLYPGEDGVARAADLKIFKGETNKEEARVVRRAVKTLCPLPTE